MDKLFIYAAVAGIVGLTISIPASVLSFFVRDAGYGGAIGVVYVALMILTMALTVFFLWGFAYLGRKINSSLLEWASYASIAVVLVYLGGGMLLPSLSELSGLLVIAVSTILYGAAAIAFGAGVLKLKPHFDSLATAAGVLDIIAGAFFVTVVLSFLGILVALPAFVIEVVILFRAASMFDSAKPVAAPARRKAKGKK